MASFLIVMILMVVITLIVVGFSQVTRRNQREALDRQLSSQAFYAAESGVNVTTSTISNYVRANGAVSLPTKTSCPTSYDPTNGAGTGTAIADLSAGVRYTCVLVNPNPSTLLYSPTQRGSVVVPLQANGNINKLTFSWTMQDGGTDNTCTGNNPQVFPAAAAWTCDFGVLRVDMVANPGGNLANLPGNTVTTYMTPLGGHLGTVPIANFNIPTTPRVHVASAKDCGTGTCSVSVDLVNTTPSYYLRITSLYKDVREMTISGTIAGGATATFSGAQAVVDTTGQAQDQLRRIQVRVQLNASEDPNTIPSNALGSSADICKRFSIMPTDSVDVATLCT
jgi:hypothetical protein